jgi:hypothetical protein
VGWLAVAKGDCGRAAQRRLGVAQRSANCKCPGDGIGTCGNFINFGGLGWRRAPEFDLNPFPQAQSRHFVLGHRKQDIPLPVLCQPNHGHARTQHLTHFCINPCDHASFVGHQFAVAELVAAAGILGLGLLKLGLRGFELTVAPLEFCTADELLVSQFPETLEVCGRQIPVGLGSVQLCFGFID